MELKIITSKVQYYLRFLLGLVIFFFSIAINSQEELNSQNPKFPGEAPTVRFEHIGLEEGLAQQTVYDIIQDKKGYLWITTQGGLHRYNGYEFEIFSNTPFDSTSLSSNYINSVTETSNGDLWIATVTEGLDFMDKSTETFTNYSHEPKDSMSLSSNQIFDVQEAKNGDLWVSTTGTGLDHMKKDEKGKFSHYRHKSDNPNSLTSDHLKHINEDSDGKIWVGSVNGINRIDPETGNVTRFLYEAEAPAKYGDPQNVLDQYFPPNNPDIVWLATGKGLVRLNTQTGKHKRFVIEEKDDVSVNRRNYLHNVLPDPNEPGILWASGPGPGVVRFDMTKEEFTSYNHDPRDKNSLAEDEVWILFADRSGNIWAGHNTKGLSKFNPRSVNFSHLRHNPDNTASLAPGTVWDIYEDEDKNLWVSTFSYSEGGFLTEFNTKTGKIKRYRHEPNNEQSLPTGVYNSMFEDEMGEFWIGGESGLSRLNPETGHVKRFPYPSQEENRLRRNSIHKVIPTKDSKNLWIGNEAGLDLFNTKTEKFEAIEFNSNNKTNLTVSLVISEKGTLWLGTVQGVFKVSDDKKARLAFAHNSQDTTSISSNFVIQIIEREKEPGHLWLATFGGGLNRLDTQTGTATHYTEREGLANNTIYGILEDNEGSLWMSTNKGISNFDPETESFRNYTLDDGLVALEYAQGAFFKGADSTLYFGSTEGVTAFNPENLAINEIPPEVTLSGLKIFNKETKPGNDSPLDKPLADTEKFTIDHSQNEITFDFVALHYGNPSKNTYAYMLEGFDEDWIDAGTQRSATYTNLEPGTYDFKVKAANADGIWNEEGTSVEFNILPPWYKTWWAYFLFALVLGAVILGVGYWQRQYLQKKEEEKSALREAELKVEAENRRRADTEQLSKIGRTITSTLSINEIIEIVYEHVNQLMDAAIFGVGIYNPAKNRLEFPATKENEKMLPAYAHRLNEKNRLAVWCFNNNKEIIMGNAEEETGEYVKEYLPPVEGNDAKSLIYLPLEQQGRTIGVITTQSFRKNAYTDYHLHLFRNLALYASIALDNASAYRRLDATLNDLKVTQEQLVQQEKLASLGQLTAGIAHEIKNPLNFVNNFSELSVELIDEAREELSFLNNGDIEKKEKYETISELFDDIEENLKKIHKHGTRADGIVRSMLQHSRGGSGSMEPTDLNELIKEYVNLTFHGMRAGKKPINVELDLQLDEKVRKVPLVEEDFSRVIINLCNNAFDAMHEKLALQSQNGEYNPKLTVRTVSQKEFILIQVEDNGPGIPEALKHKILQPFFTTKKGTEGTGLGLSITHDIIKAHGGSLEIVSEKDSFTRFEITIPSKK